MTVTIDHPQHAMRPLMAIVVALLVCWPTASASAQTTVSTPAIAGATDATKDVNIEADGMEVIEAEKKAVFTGNVAADRGGTRLEADKMVVNYRSATQDDGSNKQEVTIIDATGNVTITTAKEVITGDRAVFEVKPNVLTVTGDVQVTQGKSVMRGTKLRADLKAKTTSLTGGRVKGSFVPGSASP